MRTRTTIFSFILIFLILNVLDIITTVYAVKNGFEANPAMDYLQSLDWGLWMAVKLLVGFVIAFAIYRLYKTHVKAARITALFIVIIYIIAAVNNAMLIASAEVYEENGVIIENDTFQLLQIDTGTKDLDGCRCCGGDWYYYFGDEDLLTRQDLYNYNEKIIFTHSTYLRLQAYVYDPDSDTWSWIDTSTNVAGTFDVYDKDTNEWVASGIYNIYWQGDIRAISLKYTAKNEDYVNNYGKGLKWYKTILYPPSPELAYRIKYSIFDQTFFDKLGYGLSSSTNSCGALQYYSRTEIRDNYKIFYYPDIDYAMINISRFGNKFTKWRVCDEDESYCVEDVYTLNNTTLYFDEVIPDHAKVWVYPTTDPYLVNFSLPSYLSESNITLTIGGVKFYFFDILTTSLISGVNFSITGDDFSDSGIYDYKVTYTSDQLTQGNTYSYTASRDGYQSVSGSFTFTGGQVIKLYFVLDLTNPNATEHVSDPVNNTALTFTVLDSETKEPVEGATVMVEGYSKLTNANGFTWFEVVKNATYHYTVSKSGYYSISGSVAVGANQTDVTVELIPISTTTTTTTTAGAGTGGGTTGGEDTTQNAVDTLKANAETIVSLCILGTILGLLKMMTRRR